MSKVNINNSLKNKFENTTNLLVEFDKFLEHWKWFLISVIFCSCIAIYKAKKTENIFQTSAKILIKQDSEGASELQAFQDLASLGLKGDNNALDEIEVLKSRTLITEVVKDLGLNFVVYKKKGFKYVEQYNESPFKFKILSEYKNFNELDTIVNLKKINNSIFKYAVGEDENFKTIKFGQKINIKNISFLVLPNEFCLFPQEKEEFKLHIVRNQDALTKISDNLLIELIDEYSNIVTLTLKYPCKEKAEAILNKLMELYNQRTIDDKNIIARKTSDFITNRLQLIKGDLENIDKSEERYKSSNKIADIEVQTEAIVENKAIGEKQLFETTNQLNLVNFMIEELKNQKNDHELLPVNIGLEKDVQLSSLVGNYNELVLEKNRLLVSTTKENPVVQSMINEIRSISVSIKKSLLNSKKQLEISLNSLKSNNILLEDGISNVPSQVRNFRKIVRKQEIVEQLYAYLLQKQEENEISLAVTTPNGKIIDFAYSNEKPVAPNKILILFAGILVGLFIPFIIIYIINLLDTKFYTKKELQDLISAPIIGDIPLDISNEKIVVRSGSRSSVAEAFRLLRTNLEFMMTNVESASKTIFVTSTISGEGKTFISVNLASTLAISGKKVLLMGMDLRAPKITQYLDLPSRSGITNYLLDPTGNPLNEMIFKLPGFETLDILSSGIVPPNPAELLLSPKVADIFKQLKEQYDYVIVDTAPVNLVTDTLMINKYADLFVYVSRANYLDKRLLEVPQKLYNEKRLNNMSVLINGLDHRRAYGYGSGYGYGELYGSVLEGEYTPQKTNWIQKIFKK